jgi:hypothetical protein
LGQQQILFDFEQPARWKRGNQANGTLEPSGEQRHGGNLAARLAYRFPSRGNDYVVFTAQPPQPIPGAPGQIGLWVYGDGSGHALKLWLKDAQGETLQFRLGFVGAPGWSFLSTPLGGQVESYNRISGRGNGRVDFPISLAAIVLDDEPDAAVGEGAIFLDDLSATSGPEAYSARFTQGDRQIQVLWAPAGGQVNIAGSGNATLVDRNGASSLRTFSAGRLTLDLGPSPVYLITQP